MDIEEQYSIDKTQVAVDVFDKNARVYEDKFMDVSRYHDTFDVFCDHVAKEDAAILDVACGPGNITRYLLDKHPGYKILGIDLAPKMLGLARINNPEADFVLMDCREIGTLGKEYDGIMCGFCMPYLSETEAMQLMKDAYGLLATGGMLYISTMEADEHNKSGIRTSSSGDKLYMYYHNADAVTNALVQSGFGIIGNYRKEVVAADGIRTVDFVVVGKRG